MVSPEQRALQKRLEGCTGDFYGLLSLLDQEYHHMSLVNISTALNR